MVYYCCAINCKESWKKGGPYTFHSFPKNPEKRKLWESKLKRVNFKVNDSTKICSKHFLPECFDSAKFGGTWLKNDAIPTIFDFPNVISNEVIPRKSIKMYKTPDVEIENSPTVPDLPSISSTSGTSNRRFHYIGDFKEDDLASPTQAKKFLHIAQAETTRYKETVRKLCRENRLLKKRITSMKSMLNDLKNHRFLSHDTSSLRSSPGPAAEFVHRLEMPTSKEKYHPELRKFALTLYFYSSKAYEHLRKSFPCSLPHPATLRKWFKSTDESSSFTNEATTLEVKAKKAFLKKKMLKIVETL